MCVICTCPGWIKKEVRQQGGKCMFVGYSDESKEYKLYNPINKKFIINKDVQFIEYEAWDGSLEKTINVATSLLQEGKEESTITCNSSIMTPPTLVQAQQSSPQVTPSKSNRTNSRIRENTPPSVQQISTNPHSPSSTLSDTSIPTLASLRRKKFRNLSDIY